MNGPCLHPYSGAVHKAGPAVPFVQVVNFLPADPTGKTGDDDINSRAASPLRENSPEIDIPSPRGDPQIANHAIGEQERI